MYGELAKYRSDDIWIEDLGLGSFFGQSFDGLMRNQQSKNQ